MFKMIIDLTDEDVKKIMDMGLSQTTLNERVRAFLKGEFAGNSLNKYSMKTINQISVMANSHLNEGIYFTEFTANHADVIPLGSFHRVRELLSIKRGFTNEGRYSLFANGTPETQDWVESKLREGTTTFTRLVTNTAGHTIPNILHALQHLRVSSDTLNTEMRNGTLFLSLKEESVESDLI